MIAIMNKGWHFFKKKTFVIKGHPMKIVIINSDRRTLAARIIKIAKTLTEKGYDVEILTWDRTKKKQKKEYINGYKVHNFRFKVPNSCIWVLIPCYMVWWVYVFFYLLMNNADGCHPLSLYSVIPVLPVKLIKKSVVIYDLTDFAADSFNYPKFIRQFLAWLENFCLKFVDGVIIVDEHRKKQINMSNVKNSAIVMNCPTDVINKFKPQKKREKFTIYYGGWIIETRGLRYICESIRDIENIELIIAGFGPDEAKLRSIFGAQSNIQFVGLLSKEESLRQTYNADVIFAFYNPKIPINRLASPNKLFDAMMCGTPILANSEALPVAEVINKENCGLIVPYENIQGIRDAILKLKEDSNLRTKMGENGRKAFEREYNWMVMERRLIALYDQIVGN